MQLDYEATQMITTAVETYFAAERRWLITIVASCAVIAVLATVLFFIVRDGFTKGFFIAALCTVGLFATVCGSLLLRDPKISSELIAAAQTQQATQAVAQESARLNKIMSNFASNRWGILVVAAAAIAFGAFLPWDTGKGVAVCLFFVAALLVCDRYSELRVDRYRQQLASAVAPPG